MDLGSLMKDLRGHVAELKKTYFATRQPVTDDNSDLHNFCVKLEHILRYGQKEKYSIVGGRKDYWNFLGEALPKDETIRFIQALGDAFRTNQGKGRAFIRQALVEKALADTLQRCVIHHKAIRDWYHQASVIRDPDLFGILLHSLYDLNSVEFTLPTKGYNLDRAWPSFARKSFSDNSRVKRSESTTDVDGSSQDPLPAVAAQVEAIKQLVIESSGKATEVTEPILKEVSMQQVLNGLSEIYKDLELWKNISYQKVKDLATELKFVSKEREALEREVKLTDAVKETLQGESDKAKEYCGKLKVADLELKESKKQVEYLKSELDGAKAAAKLKISELQREVYTLNKSVCDLKDKLSARDATENELLKKTSSLEETLNLNNSRDSEVQKKVSAFKIMLIQKEAEIESLKVAFEKATGMVADSFQEFEKEVISRINARDKDSELNKDDNNILYFKYESSKKEAESLKEMVFMKETELAEEKKTRENSDKVIKELMEKFAVEEEERRLLEDVVDGIIAQLIGIDSHDGIVDSEDGLTKKKDKKWVLQKLSVMHQQLIDTIRDKEQFENNAHSLKNETVQLKEKIKEIEEVRSEEVQRLGTQKDKALQELESMKMDYDKISLQVQNKDKEIFVLSDKLSDCTELLSIKEKELERLKATLNVTEENFDKMKLLKEQFEREKKTLEEEIVLKEDKIRMLGMDSEAQVSELHQKVDETSKKLFESQEKLNETQVSLAGRMEINMQLDRSLADLKDQLKSLRQTKDQQIQALRFQLSSEEMKHQGAIRALGDKLRECDMHQQKVQEMEKVVESYKGNIHKGHENWQKEREILVLQAESLTDEMANQKEKIESLESELSVLEHELLRTTKQRDEEKSQRIIQAEKLELVLADARGKEKQMHGAMGVLQQDVQELKAHLVAVTKEKSDLWQRSDLLEFELKQRSEGRWVDDEEVLKCSDCRTEFSLLIRKHHCRICGHIFCAMCSNNWVRTQHSRKKLRACNDCSYAANLKSDDAHSDGNQEEVKVELNETAENDSTLSPDDLDHDKPSSDDAYEVLSEHDVTELNDSPPIEEITILHTDLECDPLLPSLTIDDEVSKEKKEIQIYSRQRFLIPVVVGSAKVDLYYEFNSTPKDIGFGIIYKKDEQADNSEIETIMALKRYPSDVRTIFGKVIISKPGIYIMVFDNSFSRITAKVVTCWIGLQRTTSLT